MRPRKYGSIPPCSAKIAVLKNNTKEDAAVSDNILKKSLDVTCEDFLRGIYAEKSKPEWEALMTLFGEIVTGK